MDDKILEGTTTVGITCEDGVVFASERRASMGNLVAHKVAEKIFKIDDHIVTTIAGSVGDAQSLMKVIEAEVSLYEMRNNDGSGSIVAYGVLEDRFRDDLTTDEGLEIAIRAIRAAAERDTYSGNGYLVAKVTKDGFEMLDNEKINEILGKI